MNVLIILGNGFSIDFIDHIEKSEIIDVKNLFHLGEKVPWPSDDSLGYLSFKHCPNLWNLGARPYMDADSSLVLIEDIITCANMLDCRNHSTENSNKIYLLAYKELVQYLKTLFIYYNRKIDFRDIDLQNKIKQWSWYKKLELLNQDHTIEKVHIITFNYDIWLERILKLMGVDYNIAGFENKDSKFQIYKPHGSISFQAKVARDKAAYAINYNFDVPDDRIEQFDIEYDHISPLGSINALIPPAGDSGRLSFKWADTIRNKIGEAIKTFKSEDELILCGLSYWHVDRSELDKILGEIPIDISNVSVFNPQPPRALNAVLTTFFQNVVNYTNCKHLFE